MNDREKLIEMLTEPLPVVESPLGDEFSPKMKMGLIYAGNVADHLLANGVTFHKWVPTALGFFPEEHGRYLCVVRSFAFPGRFYRTILQYDNYGFREGNIYTDDVAYWMPLPEPPKEEDND
jgi:hypothetical protein